MEFNPSEWAIRWLESQGIPAGAFAYPETMTEDELQKIVDSLLTEKGRVRAFLSRIFTRQTYKLRLELRNNTAATMARIKKMKKFDGMEKESPEYKKLYKETVARNLRNTISGTLSRGMSLWCRDHIPASDLAKIKIKWLSSHALHHDIDHARHYGQTMSLLKAFRTGGTDQGLGVRYGCKCGARVVAGADLLASYLKRSPYKAIIRVTK